MDKASPLRSSPPKRNQLAWYRALVHLAVWTTFVYLNVQYLRNWLPANKLPAHLGAIWAFALAHALLLMAATYGNSLYLLPRLYFNRRYGAYFLLLLAAVVLTCCLKVQLDGLFLPASFPLLFSFGHYLTPLPFLLTFLILASWERIMEEFARRQVRTEQLEKAKAEAELRWLRAQINPHFLFNTLHNIYSLIHFNSAKAGPSLLGLAEMMRYLLHDGTRQQVPISKELLYLEQYVALQHLNKKWREKSSLEIQAAVGAPNFLVEPMLLINFVENAFKHGNLTEDGAWLKVRLVHNEQGLQFEAENTFRPSSKKDATPGIGLANIRQRLALLYPTSHTLSISTDAGVYKVVLALRHLPAVTEAARRGK
ncbi:sensor histidine kinase [Hymenobacter weizhouensis]|uniref:sensor histidine kinase n=1 Tax=Hymenobacter sp. YIM 151500-1 TaxID=2987689 RepID=UPI002225F9AD|nr:histidine kinase [Hymenobacter sp. YIM 151500-1]UYZ61518.1 histidine kinase [Hymenobacter sp. YIM 151500-1]